MCGEPLSGKDSILMNRYVLTTRKKSLMVEVRQQEDAEPKAVYRWPDLDGDDECGTPSGARLCWPSCMLQWIEGELIALAAGKS